MRLQQDLQELTPSQLLAMKHSMLETLLQQVYH